jgi:hypothetical protein
MKNKPRFLRIASELGWEQVEEDVMVFKRASKDDYVDVNFVTCQSYDNFDLDDERIDSTFVNNYICKIGCCNKVKKEHIAWGIPLLISDYFGHRGNREEELLWAKKAVGVKLDLFPNAFPRHLADKLNKTF